MDNSVNSIELSDGDEVVMTLNAPTWTNDSPRRWWGVVITDNCEFEAISIINHLTVNSKINAWVFQREFSEEGFPHWQVTIGWQGKCGKKTIGDYMMTMHPSITLYDCQIMGVDRNFAKYCAKSNTRVEGPWSYMIAGVPCEPIKVIATKDFYPWQKRIWDIMNGPADDRTIYWIWEDMGNTGKTSLTKKTVVELDRVLLARSGASDTASRIIKGIMPPKVVIFDFARTQESYVGYTTVEEVKNGMAVSNKYEGGQVAFNNPHVVCFANFPPDMSKLSADRWDV